MNEFALTYGIVEIDMLKEHEEIDKERLKRLKNEIISDNMLKKSIAVDKNTNVILDGHHRLRALKELFYKRIPVVFVDYQLPEIQVQAWKKGEIITKDMVINAALNGKKFPPKTSKHMVLINGKLKHISTIEKKVNILLEDLK